MHTKCLFLLGDGCYTVAARRAQLLRRVSHCGKFEIAHCGAGKYERAQLLRRVSHCGKFEIAHCGKYERVQLLCRVSHCGKFEIAHCGKYERVQLLYRVPHCGKSRAVKNWLLLEKVRKTPSYFELASFWNAKFEYTVSQGLGSEGVGK